MRMARLELASQRHTPLKRARIPIPPHPRIAYTIKKSVNYDVRYLFCLITSHSHNLD